MKREVIKTCFNDFNHFSGDLYLNIIAAVVKKRIEGYDVIIDDDIISIESIQNGIGEKIECCLFKLDDGIYRIELYNSDTGEIYLDSFNTKSMLEAIQKYISYYKYTQEEEI
jgi:hypothetical protein